MEKMMSKRKKKQSMKELSVNVGWEGGVVWRWTGESVKRRWVNDHRRIIKEDRCPDIAKPIGKSFNNTGDTT